MKTEKSVASKISKLDNDIWNTICEFHPEDSSPSGLYDFLQLRGKNAAVIGPYYLPHDPLALQLSYSVGLEGNVYSIDPQGQSVDGNASSEFIVGSGDSSTYDFQLRILRELGLPLGNFYWLGPESSLSHIPYPDDKYDCIADHGTLEFLAGIVDATYFRQGAMEIFNALRPGGFYVHHCVNTAFLNYSVDKESIYPDSFTDFMISLGMRMTGWTFQSDSYVLPATNEQLKSIQDSSILEQYFPQTREILLMKSTNNLLIIPQHVLSYPTRSILVMQKLHQ